MIRRMAEVVLTPEARQQLERMPGHRDGIYDK
jgi:hypothetical protein